MTLLHLSPNDGASTDTELFLSELSSSPDQNATIQFSHQRFVPSDSLIPESGDHHPEIAPFLDVEQSVSLSIHLLVSSPPVPCSESVLCLTKALSFILESITLFIPLHLACFTPHCQTLSRSEQGILCFPRPFSTRKL